MRVILVHPQIPQNAGNVVRTCKVTGADLTLVRPLGFSTSSRHLKRAGLDYWDGVRVDIVDSLELDGEFYLFTTKTQRRFTDVRYTENSVLVFGSETSGLPRQLLERYEERCVTMPMLVGTRSLNLSNTVAIALYEALRQQDFRWQR